MRTERMKLVTAAVLALVVTMGLAALGATPAAHAACKPVVCPAIAFICPQGQVACRPSPCNCAFVCAAEGHGCNALHEPL